jgi:hypothetical protein
MDLLGLFIGYPWVAFVVAAAFLVGWRTRRVPLMILAAICWAAYGAYEYAMQTALVHGRVQYQGRPSAVLSYTADCIGICDLAVLSLIKRRHSVGGSAAQ